MGDLSQILLEWKRVIFSITLASVRTPSAPLDQFFEVFLPDHDGAPVEAILTRSAGLSADFELHPFDRAGAEQRRKAAQDSFEAGLAARRAHYDSVAEANRRKAEEAIRLRTEQQKEADADRIRRIEEFGTSHHWKRLTIDLVGARQIEIGMDKQMVTFAWGTPLKVTQTITAAGTTEQWVYSGERYVYFTNGVVTTIQK